MPVPRTDASRLAFYFDLAQTCAAALGAGAASVVLGLTIGDLPIHTDAAALLTIVEGLLVALGAWAFAQINGIMGEEGLRRVFSGFAMLGVVGAVVAPFAWFLRHPRHQVYVPFSSGWWVVVVAALLAMLAGGFGRVGFLHLRRVVTGES